MDQLVLYDHPASICSQMARLALHEKQLAFTRHPIDIMTTNEQFEPWYIALNPKAVVPTLQIGDRIVTDTLNIVNEVQLFPGPDLSGDETTQTWLKDIMALHYGILLYRNRRDPDGTAPQIIARGTYLAKLRRERPDLAEMLDRRLAGNKRFQELLKDPVGTQQHIQAVYDLIQRFVAALDQQPFLAGQSYSLADCFATAALARFTIHGFDQRWAGTAVDDYYARVKARPSFADAEVLDTGTERDL
jgi:glutathione S-transferase